MYEFTNKEIRKKFKETEYGKKTNSWLYTSISVTVFLLCLILIIGSLYYFNVLKIKEEVIIVICGFLSTLWFISLITTCYFDGKRDGAIEQYKRDLKK